MSFNTMAWAFNQSPNKSPQKHLLLALAYRADANNQCYPSISCLIRDTGMGRRTIQEHLRELLAQNFINITERIGSSNLYTLINKCEDETEADNPEPFSQHSSEKTADLPCETCIQNKSLKTSLSKEKNENGKIRTPIDTVDDLNPEMKAAHDWAKKEPFWSPKIAKIVNFIRFYTLGDLKNQYLNFLNKKQTRPSYKPYRQSSGSVRPTKKIKSKELWERWGFKSEKDYQDDIGRKAMEKMKALMPESKSDKPSIWEEKVNRIRMKQKLKREKEAALSGILSPAL